MPSFSPHQLLRRKYLEMMHSVLGIHWMLLSMLSSRLLPGPPVRDAWPHPRGFQVIILIRDELMHDP